MGRGAARAVAARGGEAWVTSRTADRLADAQAAVTQGLEPRDGATGLGVVHATLCDLADADSVRDAIAAPPTLDHLIVTASPGRGLSDREFFDGKFWGTQAACVAAAERLPANGSIVLNSGGLAVRPVRGEWATTCAFAAVEALARALAVELAPRRVNCIRPGLFDTGTWADMDPDQREEFFAKSVANLPAGRPATGDDFGDAVAGLLGSGYVTGQVIVVDGGQSVAG